MDAKALFLRDKDLAKWWVAVAHDSRFEQACAYALVDFLSGPRTADEVQGAKDFINSLGTITDNTVDVLDVVSPGLIHNMESMPEKPDIDKPQVLAPVEQPKVKAKKAK